MTRTWPWPASCWTRVQTATTCTGTLTLKAVPCLRSQPLDKGMLRLFVTKGRADLDAPSGDEQGGDCTIRGEILRSPDHHFRDIVHLLTKCGIPFSPPPHARAGDDALGAT